MKKTQRTLALTLGLTIISSIPAYAAPTGKPTTKPDNSSVQKNVTPAAAKPVTKAQLAAEVALVTYANSLLQNIADHGGKAANSAFVIKDVLTAIGQLPVPATIVQTQTATSVFLSPKAYPTDILELKIVNSKIAFLSNGFKIPSTPAPKSSLPTKTPSKTPAKK